MTKQELIASLEKDALRAETELFKARERGDIQAIEDWAYDFGLAKGMLMTITD